MTDTVRVLAISGSLRQGSYNTAAIRAAKELKPDGMEIEVASIGDFPLYNEDIQERGWPEPVARVRRQAEEADGLLLASPEYNYSVTGVLKNALDWLSRPAAKAPIIGKPLGVIGASMSMVGTARSQADVRQIAYYNAMPVLPGHEVLIARAQDKFDREGRLTDEATRKFLGNYLQKYAAWLLRLRAQS
jgi:chromate reductase